MMICRLKIEGYKIQQCAVCTVIHTQLGDHLRPKDLVIGHSC